MNSTTINPVHANSNPKPKGSARGASPTQLNNIKTKAGTTYLETPQIKNNNPKWQYPNKLVHISGDSKVIADKLREWSEKMKENSADLELKDPRCSKFNNNRETLDS